MPSPIYQELEIVSSFGHATKAEACIIEAAMRYNFSEDDIFALKLSMEEALTNAIKHGNKNNKNKKINVRYFVNSDRADIYIADEGDGFSPLDVPDPTKAENLILPCGRGIMLMRTYMNLVEYNDIGNVVHMIKLCQKP